jgi:hypothetical protein
MGDIAMSLRRKTWILLVVLIASSLLIGCPWRNRKGELPTGRRAKVVVFPVRHLKFENLRCEQELEQLELSGSLQNVSPYPLSNVRLRIDIFFAGDPAKADIETLVLQIERSPLEPSEWAHFSVSETVKHPVAHAEIRAFWD